MNYTDIAIVILYVAGLFAWAIHVGLRETAEDFLVLSRRAPLLLVMFSVVSTWVGVGTTVATAASGYDKGISLGLTAASGGLTGALIVAWFAPRLKWFGDNFQAHTIGDFLCERYSKHTRSIASSLIFIVYILLTAAQLVGLSTLLQVWTGISFEVIVWFAALSTIVYTAFAGIKSDFYTDIIHFVVMSLVFFIILLPIALTKIGGLHAFRALPQSYFNPFAYGGVSFFVAGLIFGGGSVFVTMELWQRVYASSSGTTARRALSFSIVIIVLFYLASTIFGMVARVIEPNLADRDQAIFFLMKQCLPIGLLGLGIAAFVAVFVSTVNSMMMVASATFTKDFYKGIFNQNADDRVLLLVGRVSTLGCGFLALVVAILLPDLVALSVNSMFMLLILIPSVVGGFFWKKATSKGAFVSIVLGIITMAIFLPWNPEAAFVPGFIASLLSFIIISTGSKHSEQENLSIVRGWKDSKLMNRGRR